MNMVILILMVVVVVVVEATILEILNHIHIHILMVKLLLSQGDEEEHIGTEENEHTPLYNITHTTMKSI